MRDYSYTEEATQWLIANYAHTGATAAAAVLNRDPLSIRKKAWALGLHYEREVVLCSVPDCTSICHAKGLCRQHYKRSFVSAKAKGKTCREEGCSKPAKYSNGFCHSCYSKYWAREHHAEYYQKNKEKIKAYHRALFAANSEKIKEQNRKYRAENRDHVVRLEQTKLILDSEKAYSVYDNKCEYCGSKVLPVLEWHHRTASNGRRDTKHIVRRVAKEGNREDGLMLLCGNCHQYMNLKDGTNRQGHFATRIWLFGGRTWFEKRAEKILKLYDFRCGCCGDEDPMSLSWHHRLGGNYEKREHVQSMFKRIIKTGERAEDILLLCRSCHILVDMVDRTNDRGINQLRVLYYRKTGKIKINIDASAWAARFVQKRYGKKWLF